MKTKNYHAYLTLIITLILSALYTLNSHAEMIYAVRAANGLMGYQTADSTWVMRPCASRLDVDSLDISPEVEYVFAVDFNGKKGVATSSGGFLLPPQYKDVHLLTGRDIDYGAGKYKIIPRNQVEAVCIRTGEMVNKNDVVRFYDLESGIDLANRTFLVWNKTPILNHNIDINRETGVNRFTILTGHPIPIEVKGLPENSTPYYVLRTCDTTYVYDFNGKELVPPTVAFHDGKKFRVRRGGKDVNHIPVASVMVDGEPCLVEIVSSSNQALQDQICNYSSQAAKVKNTELFTLAGKKIKTPKWESRYWEKTGTYRPLTLPANVISNKDKRSLQAVQAEQALKTFGQRRHNAIAENMRLIAEHERQSPAYLPSPEEWTTVGMSTDSAFSIIEYNGRKGIALDGQELTVACIYDDIQEVDGVPGVFSLRDAHGVGLSDGYSVTIPTGFKRITVGNDGVITMRQTESPLPEDIEYVEYADFTGIPTGNNLDSILNGFAEMMDKSTENKSFIEIVANADSTGRKFIKPYVFLYFAIRSERMGFSELAFSQYQTALNLDSRLQTAKDRIEALQPVVDNIREQRQRELELQRQAQENEKYAALSEMLAQLSEVSQNIHNLRRQHKANKAKRAASRNRRTASTLSPQLSTTTSSRATATSEKSANGNKPKLSSADMANCRIDGYTYNQWNSKLIAMKYRNWPYSNGYTMDDVRNAQNNMREIRKKWEAKGNWPYGKGSMEDWDGR